MAKSWGKKKKALHNLTPHRQKLDKDNLEKALLDALFSKYSDEDSKKNDSHVWDGRVIKLWSYEPKIEIYEIDCVLKAIGARNIN